MATAANVFWITPFRSHNFVAILFEDIKLVRFILYFNAEHNSVNKQ